MTIVWGYIKNSFMKITIPERTMLVWVKHHCIFIFSIICCKNTEETKKKYIIAIFIVVLEVLGKSEPKATRNVTAHKSVWS